jgi:hypothetical protein
MTTPSLHLRAVNHEETSRLHLEFVTANENMRFYSQQEQKYFQLNLQTTTLLLIAYWLVSDSVLLRNGIAATGLLVALGALIAAYRWFSFVKASFKLIADIAVRAKMEPHQKFCDSFMHPRLRLRTVHVIYAYFTFSTLFWAFILGSDLLDAPWFDHFLTNVQSSRAAVAPLVTPGR